MSPGIISSIVILALCLLLSALFSASDMAYSSVSLLRLEKRAFIGDAKARRALRYAKDYDKTIATILFGNDFVNILASSLATAIGVSLLTGAMGEEAGATVSSLALLIVMLLFCEILPKAIAKNHSYAVSVALSPFLAFCQTVFFPLVYPANRLAEFVASPLLEKAGPESRLVSDEELEAMVADIEKEGIIDEGKSRLLHRSIEFKETSCYEIMTPRVRIVGYDIETSFDDFLKRPDAFSFSRLIVYKGDLDHVLGYISVKALLRVLVKGGRPDAQKLLLPIVSVPRTMMISDAMRIMKETHHHIALVRDEYGGTEGILTLEDILEELVGEMWDEKDKPEPMIVPLPEQGSYLVKGSMNIDDFFEFFGMDPDKLSDDYSTVSGWIVDELGRFAKVGDHFAKDRLKVTVTKCDAFTVLEAKVRRLGENAKTRRKGEGGDGTKKKEVA